MTSHDIDKLLEQTLSGDAPDPAFRTRILDNSLAALQRTRRIRARYARMGCGIAAVFVVGISFLLGRCSAPRSSATSVIADAAEEVTVPNELVEWLEAAQLFRQLGMADRMARAVERASRLVPRDRAIVAPETGPVFADRKSVESQEKPMTSVDRAHPPVAVVNRVLARSSGD